MDNKKRIRELSGKVIVPACIIKLEKDYKKSCSQLRSLRKHRERGMDAGYYDAGSSHRISTKREESYSLRRKLLFTLKEYLYG